MVVISTDFHRVQQCLVNLISNALKFSDRGKSIKIVLSKVQRGPYVESVRIMVEDEGIGICPEEVNRVFDKFFATNDVKSQEKNPQRHGIGLHISLGIMKQLGGSIEVESTVGVGSTFTIFIPNH